MTTTVDARTARRALACLTEPGSGTLVESARVRLGSAGLDRIVDGALGRTRRIGARIVTPEDDEWPAQLADLALIGQPGGDRIARDTFPPICLWVRGERPLAGAFA